MEINLFIEHIRATRGNPDDFEVEIQESLCYENYLVFKKRLKGLSIRGQDKDIRYKQVSELVSNLRNYKKKTIYTYTMSSGDNFIVTLFANDDKTEILGVFEFDKWRESDRLNISKPDSADL